LKKKKTNPCSITAERIELWIHFSPKAAPSTPSSQSFEYLGFISLSDNSSTQYQSRELQSVSVVPKIGTHLKIRLGQAYENDFNRHGQVALLAINVLGEELTQSELSSLNSSSSALLNTANNLDHLENIASICDDLSFSMYVEESVAYIVREMEERKLKAVNGKQRSVKILLFLLQPRRYYIPESQSRQIGIFLNFSAFFLN
jgi:centrosomal protein CEP104